MSQYMTFDGTSCEEYGLKLLADSVVWTPAEHKGGLLDIPGGSEPVNYSEFVSGQPEYAVGGQGESARFLVYPPLKGQADTVPNRFALLKRAKRLLHGRTVELSDSYHPEYAVSAVCSVEVDETWGYTAITLTWQRDPIRLMSQGSAEVFPEWEQADFDPEDNVLLALANHPDIDTSKCGWDYAEVEGRPTLPNPENPDVVNVVLYCYCLQSGGGSYEYTASAVETFMVPVSGISSGSYYAYNEVCFYFDRRTSSDAAPSASELEAVSGYYDGEYGKCALVDVQGHFAELDVFAGYDEGDWAKLYRRMGMMIQTMGAAEFVYGRPYLFESKAVDTAGPVPEVGYLTRDYAAMSYGKSNFAATGYYRYAEDGDDSFPGIAHGMNEVPSAWLVEAEPSWYASRPVTDYGWPYILVSEEPQGYTQFQAASSAAHVYYAEYDGAFTFHYYSGTTDADARLAMPAGLEAALVDSEEVRSWFEAQNSYTASAATAEGAISEFEAHIARGPGGEVQGYRVPVDTNPEDDNMMPNVFRTFGSPGYDYMGYFAWDPSAPGMRQAKSGDSWQLGKVYSDRIATGRTGNASPLCLYRTFAVSQTVQELGAAVSYKVMEYATFTAEEAAETSVSFSDYSFLIQRSGGAVTQSDVAYLESVVGGSYEYVCADQYVGKGWPTTPQEGSFDYANGIAFYSDGGWVASAVTGAGPYSLTGALLSLVHDMHPAGGTAYEKVGITPVPQEFATLYGATGADVGFAAGTFYATDRWTEHYIYTASEAPLAVPSSISPTYVAGLFRATFPDYAETVTEEVDTGYPFCILASSTHPATLQKDGMRCALSGGALQTDLPMNDGGNSIGVTVPYSEVDDGSGSQTEPYMLFTWKRGDV